MLKKINWVCTRLQISQSEDKILCLNIHWEYTKMWSRICSNNKHQVNRINLIFKVKQHIKKTHKWSLKYILIDEDLACPVIILKMQTSFNEGMSRIDNGAEEDAAELRAASSSSLV